MGRWGIRLGGLLAACLLSACSTVPPEPRLETADVGGSPWGSQSQPAAPSGPVRTAAWEHYAFPGKNPTQFQYVRLDGRETVLAVARSSASMLRQQVRIEPDQLGKVRFSWKVPALINEADLARRDVADSPARIVLAFEGDRSRFSSRDAMLSELARALTGEEMPYATLMYVWCNKREPGSIIPSPRTDRIRKLCVQSGPRQLNEWLDYERDIRADFEHAFGEAPGALVGVGIMTDTDNTRTNARAWYGPVQLRPRVATAR